MANKGKKDGTNPTLEQAGTDLAQGTQNLLEQMQPAASGRIRR
jgi:hypothetical protein